ncbi:LysM peptidoglycan-binding domain-containing protein [Salinicoccus albus]|uniref:LysM peptidoglycan-binding domain-containing protein n=1 Tax=Salinicoccus albus TaxID=418756 RepID=UPI000362524D|nr:LysM peptidoglycan-binding domain-containing protein [Salinicoccus albus]
MKDDFYKDLEHKRAQKETDDAHENNSDKSENSTEDKEPVMTRAARHRPKQEKKEKQNKEKTTPFKNIGQRVTGYVNKEKLGRAKAFFAGRLSAYRNRLKEELNVSKTKLSEIRNRQTNDDNTAEVSQDSTDANGGKKKNIVPIIIGGIIILPITIMLFAMITSNFWPSDTGTEGQIAGGGDEESTSEEAASEENTSENVDEDMQEQKAEMERELAESHSDEDQPEDSGSEDSGGEDSGNSNSGNDLGTGDVQVEYSEEEQDELEDASESAIADKESGSSTNDSESSDEENTEEESTEEESTEEVTQESPEEETTEQPAEEQTGESTGDAVSHVVSAEDNLYRIAIRYYGSGTSENVDRIREANGGISSDALTVGEELVIPQ